MAEVSRINDQIRRGFEGEAWHGPSVTEVLDGVDAATASARPLPDAHTIWELVLHLVGTQELVISRLQGDARELTAEEDWPKVSSATPEEWEGARKKLEANDVRLRELVSGFDDKKLDEPLVPGSTSAYVQFHGYVQHNLYHAGQIAILKKQRKA